MRGLSRERWQRTLKIRRFDRMAKPGQEVSSSAQLFTTTFWSFLREFSSLTKRVAVRADGPPISGRVGPCSSTRDAFLRWLRTKGLWPDNRW